MTQWTVQADNITFKLRILEGQLHEVEAKMHLLGYQVTALSSGHRHLYHVICHVV
jgi:hypothetical protein